MTKYDIEWKHQLNGVCHAGVESLLKYMPALQPVIDDFPDEKYNFSFDVKVHMLMPRQYPCIPNWHYDFVPRVNGVQRFDLVDTTKPMYMWVSGPPLTQFQHGYVTPECWHRFTQMDIHRGTAASEFTWRCFIRATHTDIRGVNRLDDIVRRHSQVYLDAEEFQW